MVGGCNSQQQRSLSIFVNRNIVLFDRVDDDAVFGLAQQSLSLITDEKLPVLIDEYQRVPLFSLALID